MTNMTKMLQNKLVREQRLYEQGLSNHVKGGDLLDEGHSMVTFKYNSLEWIQ